MLTDADLEWYSELLSSAIVGTAKIGFSDAVRIGKCGKAAENDKRLYTHTMHKVALKYPKIFPVL